MLQVVSSNVGRSLPSCEVVDGVVLRRVQVVPSTGDLYISPQFYRMARDGDERGKFDIVHVQNYLTFVSPLAMKGAHDGGIPYAVTFHGGGHTLRWRNRIRGIQRRLLRPLLARASRLVATARFEMSMFGDALDIPRSKFAYIPNGCDIAAAQVTSTTDPKLIISVGRLEQYKGHQRAIAAMPFILQKMPGARLRILGNGPYEPELKSQVAGLGLQQHIEVRGVPANERQTMADTLAQGGLVVSFSEYETHPMAVLEALALKRSVLVANTSGLSELAEDGYARSIDLHTTPEAYAQTMLAQLRQPHVPTDLRLPTWDDCAQDLFNLYHQMH